MKPETQSFLYRVSRSADAQTASIADNCRFDDRAGASRWDDFEKLLPDNFEWQDWAEANKLYYEDKVTTISASVPDSFLDINQAAWLKIATNRTVVRLEHLAGFLKTSNLDFKALEDLIANKEEAAQKRLKSLIENWNMRRDNRPMFAAFYDEVKEDADHDDWQHRLRNRLGLGHYCSSKNMPIPVALMRYSLDEIKSSTVPNAFCLPTVLDGGMHEFFFPSPKLHPYGATVHLTPDLAGQLTAEILHYKIDYQVKHLIKIAWITQPHELKDANLRSARDFHLIALREACKRDDFAEFMEGR